jgi:putative Holliday junction resolvase
VLQPRGRRLAVDVGSVRIGVAVCDPDGILATPVETVSRAGGDDDALARLAELVAEHEALAVIVGLPRDLRGDESFAARAVRDFAERFGQMIAPIPMIFVDERMTTVTAARALREAGRDSRSSRGVIDQAAAVAILQGWLDSGRR